jgi:hypothetical protein
MLATTRANISINSVYLARYNYSVTWHDLLRRPSREILWARRDDYCEQEFEQARGGGGPGDVFVLLSDRPRSDEMVPGSLARRYRGHGTVGGVTLARAGFDNRVRRPRAHGFVFITIGICTSRSGRIIAPHPRFTYGDASVGRSRLGDDRQQ